MMIIIILVAFSYRVAYVAFASGFIELSVPECHDSEVIGGKVLKKHCMLAGPSNVCIYRSSWAAEQDGRAFSS